MRKPAGAEETRSLTLNFEFVYRNGSCLVAVIRALLKPANNVISKVLILPAGASVPSDPQAPRAT